MRGVPGAAVEVVLTSGAFDRYGWLPDSEIWRGRTNGDTLEVLLFPGDPIIVHSVWWVK